MTMPATPATPTVPLSEEAERLMDRYRRAIEDAADPIAEEDRGAGQQLRLVRHDCEGALSNFITALEARVREAEADARRWQFVRSHLDIDGCSSDDSGDDWIYIVGNIIPLPAGKGDVISVGAAIDAALAAQAGEETQ